MSLQPLRIGRVISTTHKESCMRLPQLEWTAAAAALVLTALVGCAGMRPAARSASSTGSLPGPPACSWRRDFRGDWQVLNNSSLIVYAPPTGKGNAYYLRLVQPVVGLQFNWRLGLDNFSSGGRICGNRNASLLIPGNTPPRVLITAVQEL